MIKEVERFLAASESGELHTVVVKQLYQTKTRLGRRRYIPTSKQFVTLTGLILNPVAGDTEAFQVADMNEIIRKVCALDGAVPK
jgi:hypothetical protein